MESTDEILKRFEQRTADAKANPRPVAPPPAPPPKIGKRAPTDDKSVKILTGAISIAEEMMLGYPEGSVEAAALMVLSRFAKDMIS